MCEKSVKIGHFSHVFHMVFHIHTPSSAYRCKLLSDVLCILILQGRSLGAIICYVTINKDQDWGCYKLQALTVLRISWFSWVSTEQLMTVLLLDCY